MQDYVREFPNRWVNRLASSVAFVAAVTCPCLAEPTSVPIKGTNVTAQAFADRQALTPGGTVELVVALEMKREWHVYWRSAGPFSGLPTDIRWTLPDGFKAGPIQSPSPELYVGRAGEESWVHNGRALFLTEVKVPATAKPGETIVFVAEADWLVCKEECIKGDAKLTLTLPVAAEAAKPANTELFQDARRAMPLPAAKAKYLKITGSIDKQQLKPGAEVMATVVVEIDKSHHIHSHKPVEKELVPTTLFVAPTEGMETGDIVYPPPHEVKQGGKLKSSEYKGKVVFKFPVTVDQAPEGDDPPQMASAISGVLRYQACADAGTCFPPMSVAFDIPLTATKTVAAADMPNGPAGEVAIEPPVVTLSFPTKPSVEAKSDPVSPAARWDASRWKGDKIPWQHYRRERAMAHVRAGYTVFVDYTADWCANCKANLQLAIDTEAVRKTMRSLNVVPYEADYTNEVPEIKEDLQRFGKAGVPMYLVYRNGDTEHPQILPELLTEDLVISALGGTASGGGFLGTLTRIQIWLLNRGILGTLIAAFIGGFVMNLMPCVLPVISLKVLSFVRQAQEERWRIFGLGLTYSAGILAFFLALAVMFFQFGKNWGSLFQSPALVIMMAGSVLGFALSLFGVFVIFTPKLVNDLGVRADGEGYVSAFFTGVLATLLGTACTAPFLSAAVSYATQMPMWQGTLVFIAVGLGMASPIVVLTYQPAWLRFVPRAGHWMETFEAIMGFVLLATVIWLLNPLAGQIGGHGLMLSLIFLLAVAVAVWIKGEISHGAPVGRKLLLYFFIAMVLAAGWVVPFRWMSTMEQLKADQLERQELIADGERCRELHGVGSIP